MLQSLTQSLTGTVTTLITDALREHDQRQERRLDGHERQLEALRTTQEECKSKIATLDAATKTLQDRLLVVSSAEPIPAGGDRDDVNRDIDKTIFRVSVKRNVAKAEVAKTLACHVDRRKGRASLSWEPFVELKVDIPADPSATRYSLVWDYEIVDKHNIDKDAVLAAFSDLEPSRREPSFRP